MQRASAEISARLAARREELEEAVLARVYGIADPAGVEDPSYIDGLRTSVSTALSYALEVLEQGELSAPPAPPVLFLQARLAARNGVSVEIVLRRYFAGYSVIAHAMIEEAVALGLDSSDLQPLFRREGMLFELLIAAVSEEHAREPASNGDSAQEQRRERVRRLLRGEMIDVASLAYQLDGFHLGLIAIGPDATAAFRGLAQDLGRRLLAVRWNVEATYAWFGGGAEFSDAEVERCSSWDWPAQTAIGMGEPAEGISGWRLTHRQAAAIVPVAVRRGDSVVRYLDAAVLASVLVDEVLVTSLREIYLRPLQGSRHGDDALLATLRAYFASGRNVSSAAAALGISRRTVSNRLNAIEELLGRSVSVDRLELEIALRLEQHGRVPLHRAKEPGHSISTLA
jgi:hypothetical protein